ncbi:MAG: hypothetical protein AB1545_01515 [Thermodesulfobacteriota bacterium]
MAANEITTINPIPPAAQQIASSSAGGGAYARRLSGAKQVQAAAAATQEADPILQNELMMNETLRTVNSAPGGLTNTPLIKVTPPPLAAPEATQGNIMLQNELLRNQALQNLSYVSQPQADTLLINETPPQLAADETLQNLNAVQQNELLSNQALLNLNVTPQGTTPAAEAAATARVTSAAAEAPAAAPRVAEQAAAVAVAAVEAAAVPTLAAGETTTVLTPTPIAASFAAQQFTPFPVPFFLLNPDRTPYVLAVYETKNPNPDRGEPAPIPNEVQPPLPAGRARPVGRAALRQAWANYRARIFEENTPAAIAPAERDLRHVLTQVNADLTANGLPLHLVVTKKEGRYALNVYDCSDNEACRLTRNVPLTFEDATITNLQQETGIIINTSS